MKHFLSCRHHCWSTMLAAFALCAGCSQAEEAFGPGYGGAGGGGGQAGGGDAGSSAQGGSGGIEGPGITIRFRAHTDPVDHDDGLSGQTPIDHVSGVRKLQLLVGAADPNPVTVFDFGSDWVEIGYNDGDDTAVYTVPVSSVPPATYTFARVVHSHARYRVTSTMHVNGLHLPGEFNNLQVLSDGTMLDGQLRDHGYYEYIFSTGGEDYTQSGNNAPLPQGWDSGGFSVGFENGEWAYRFPISLTVPTGLNHDVDVILEVNMHESFRWQDQDQPGYQPGVFDTTPVASEPVIRFGANSYWVTVE